MNQENNPVLDILNSNVVSSDSNQNNKKEEEADATTVPLRNKKTSSSSSVIGGSNRPVSIMDRLSKLQVAQNSWQDRVGEKDAGKFTVAGKMQRERVVKSVLLEPTSSVEPTPTRDRSLTPTRDRSASEGGDVVRSTPMKRVITGQKATVTEGNNSPTTSRRPLSTPNFPTLDNMDDLDMMEDIQEVNVLQHDEELFENFFTTSKASPASPEEEAANMDLDAVQTNSLLLALPKKTARPTNKRRARNPIKQLAARTDLKETYYERISMVNEEEEEKQNGSGKVDNKHSHLAAEALAGLASKEDFSSVQLRQSDTSQVGRGTELIPYKTDLMLLQIKGRRACQPRLVEPTAKSVNSGDAYVLCTPQEVFLWQGKFANVIERSRSAEMAQTIYQKRDLCCKRARKMHVLEEEKCYGSSKAERDFWNLLGGSPGKAEPPGHEDEDEKFESEINQYNMVWEVRINAESNEELLPVEDAWGFTPKYSILNPSKVLVLDFGSEVYVWNGKDAPFDLRRAGANLVKKVWEDGYDYSGADRPNPVLGTSELTGTRPEWGFAGRVNHKMETSLFREKFLDWPDGAKVVRVKEDVAKMDRAITFNSGEVEVEAFDAHTMASWEVEEPNLELEGSYLGRGRGYYDVQERRQYEIETIATKNWHVNEHGVKLLPNDWAAQFHNEDTYVVRWTYKVSLTGRDLKGRPSKHAAVGRERCAYFFWQGAASKTTEKGASALMTVDLDEEKGPQIRVDQGREDAVFLNLWKGKMTVHAGRRGRPIRANRWRLFVIRGEFEEEIMAVEVECTAASLRSVGSFVATNGRKLIIWHGSSSQSHTRKLAKIWANKSASDMAPEMGLEGSPEVQEEFESCESEELSQAFDLEGHSILCQYAAKMDPPAKSPRLFYMTSVSGNFEVAEVLCLFRRTDVLNTMPFSQSDLYIAEQPGNKLYTVAKDNEILLRCLRCYFATSCYY